MSSMREELDRALSGMALSPARRAAILAAAERGEKPVKKVIRPALVLAAVLTALTVSALALVPGLRESLAAALGSFAPYSQTVEDGTVCTDQDVEVRVVSTILDKSGGSVFLSVRDLTGKRFDSEMPCISYDPVTSTALVEKRVYFQWDDRDMLVSSAGADVGEQLYHTVKLNTIYTDEPIYVQDVKLPKGIVITDQVLETQPLGPGGDPKGHADHPVLVPEQTPMKLEGTDLFTLSSAGFDRDGALHIQIKLADGVYLNNNGMVFCTVSGASEELVSYFGNVLEGGRYVDCYYPSLHFDKASDVVVEEFGGQFYKKPAISGSWELTFPLELLPERVVTVGQGIPSLTGIQVEQITFSVVGMRLQGSTQGLKNGATLHAFSSWLFLKDGSKVALKNGSGQWSYTGGEDTSTQGKFNQEYSLENPVEPDQVVGISFGYWMIPLDGGTAGPGYWLKELP